MAPSNSPRKALALVVILMFFVGISAQTLTIPAELSRAGVSLVHTVGDESGLPPTMAQILAKTDAVVRGKIGAPLTYLSDDQQEIYTDYPISNPVFLYQSDAAGSTRPGLRPTVTVTVLGGTMVLSGLSYTSRHISLPSLETGTECLLLLERVGSKYRIAGRYYGAFGIHDGKLAPLTSRQGFAPKYQGASADQTAEEIVAQLRARR
jgi:hypothetical protein